MSVAGSIERTIAAVGPALAPLARRLTPARVPDLFSELGLNFPSTLTSHAAFMSAVSGAQSSAATVLSAVQQLTTDIDSGNAAAILTDGAALIAKIADLLGKLGAIQTELAALSGAFPGISPADITAFASNLPRKILDLMVIEYLESTVCYVVDVAAVAGLVDRHSEPGVPADPAKPPFEVRQLRLDRLTKLLQSPADHLKNLYGWGSPGFNADLLLKQLLELAGFIGLPALIVPAGGGNPAVLDMFGVAFHLDSSVNPPGLHIDLRLPIATNFTNSITLTPTKWALNVTTSGTFNAGIGAQVTAPTRIVLTPPSGTLDGSLQAQLSLAGADANHPIVLFGQTGGSVLQADSIGFGAGAEVKWNSATGKADVDPSVHFSIKGGKAVIDTTQGDGFLQTVLSGVHIEAGFDLSATWRADTGIHIDGGAQLEIDLPLHLSLGPVQLPILYLVGGINDGALALEVSAALGLTLGPIQAAVDRVGVKGLITFPDHGGNLGPANLAIAFKSPNGLGIAIDAGVVAGGGYILFNPDKSQYAGVLDVTLAEIIQVKIIGVLDTILPDGSHGFSFLLIITFDLPPIQLGFGFTLNGVGGLGGVNRTMNTDALHAGFRAHTLNSVLFPPDPIANAPQIISNIENFFPPADGRYLFGPMLEIGWGTPTLITLAVGVILEVPDPVRLALLGLIDAGLPTTEAALIELHIDVLGILDFGARTLSIDGSLYDSRVLIFSLSGDLALRLGWGNNPNFVFSLGGFNPHFNTNGLDVPKMHRCTVSIGDGDNPRISASNYFAITSNSLQFGANVEAFASAAGFTIHGYLGFDVLIIYSPFSFEFDFSAGFDVSFEDVSLCGLNVDGTLAGPRPWHLHGDASIHILFFSVSASLDLTWGDRTPVVLPQKPVLPDLTAALEDPRNWNAALPDGTTQAVTLSTPKPDDKTLRVHPMGTLSVRENVVPLDLAITRYGNATPSDGNLFSISDVQIDGHEENKTSFKDYFAAGQFLTLSDADKVSRPSFEKYDAGITIGSSEVLSGADSPRNVFYEERYIDEPTGFSRFARRFAMAADVHLALSRQGAGFASPLKNTGLFKYGTGFAGPAVQTQDPGYVVAHVEDLSVRTDIVSSSGSTYFQARAALDSYVSLHPEEVGNLQILPLHEVSS
jgi:hypothetical protein